MIDSWRVSSRVLFRVNAGFRGPEVKRRGSYPPPPGCARRVRLSRRAVCSLELANKDRDIFFVLDRWPKAFGPESLIGIRPIDLSQIYTWARG